MLMLGAAVSLKSTPVLHQTLAHLDESCESVGRLLAGPVSGSGDGDRWLAELRRKLYGTSA